MLLCAAPYFLCASRVQHTHTAPLISCCGLTRWRRQRSSFATASWRAGFCVFCFWLSVCGWEVSVAVTVQRSLCNVCVLVAALQRKEKLRRQSFVEASEHAAFFCLGAPPRARRCCCCPRTAVGDAAAAAAAPLQPPLSTPQAASLFTHLSISTITLPPFHHCTLQTCDTFRKQRRPYTKGGRLARASAANKGCGPKSRRALRRAPLTCRAALPRR